MTVKLYIRNDGDKYVGIKDAAADIADTFLIKPGEARELIFDEATNPELEAKVLTQEDVDAVYAAKYPDNPPAPAPAPQPPVTVPPYIIRDISNLNPIIGIVDDASGLHQGDYLVFTVTEGSDEAKDIIDGQEGQVQSLTGRNIQVGYNGSLAGDPTGVVISGEPKVAEEEEAPAEPPAEAPAPAPAPAEPPAPAPAPEA